MAELSEKKQRNMVIAMITLKMMFSVVLMLSIVLRESR
jgi:hypothetical protein